MKATVTQVVPVEAPENRTAQLPNRSDLSATLTATGPVIRREITEAGICILTFDRPDSSANVFDAATLEELNQHLDYIASESTICGVVLISAKDSIFVAGADLHALAAASREELAKIISLGQAVFNRLSGMRVPTVAAIHGACAGGGFEMCLACDYRFATTDRVTKIGLPETQLGILPGWGGSTRLPRLIGLPGALDLILNGKLLAAKPALKRGLVDELVPREKLLELACLRITCGGPAPPRRSRPLLMALTNNALFANVASLRIESRLLRTTHAHYPALFKALEVVTKGVSRSIAESLALEREAVLDLATGDESRNLVRVFFLQERARKPVAAGRESAPRPIPVSRAAVIGAGVMGAGIAHWLGSRGVSVTLRDVTREQLAKGISSIRRIYREGVQRRALTELEAREGFDRIFPAASEVSLKRAEIVIEAAVETMALKQDIFRQLDQLTRPDAILATNTSALSVSEIASAVSLPERVVGIHFFNPVHRMQLVEVAAGKLTSADVVQRAVHFARQIGKLPVVVKDSPGFLVNRILMPYLIEAGELFESGARLEDIDKAMIEFGMPMGPLRLIDEVGVDVAHHVAQTLVASFQDRLRLPRILGEMIKAGLLGRKSERGFYLYRSKHPEPNTGMSVFRQNDSAAPLAREELQERMVLLMINESARCLEDQVVSGPDDVDFGMIMGTGFAPFRGGPLQYANSYGLEQVVRDLERLAEAGGRRFHPCELLRQMAGSGRRFTTTYKGERK